MNNYNPIVAYDELIDALKSLLESSKSSDIATQYDNIKKNPVQAEKEKSLNNAIQKLERAVDEVNKKIREKLEAEIIAIDSVNILTVPISYAHTFELRKLAAQDEFVTKLTEMSLPLEMLTQLEEIEMSVKKKEEIEDLANIFEEVEESGMVAETKVEEPISEDLEPDPEGKLEEEAVSEKEEEKSDNSKIKLIKKAIEKAKEKNNLQLVKILEHQLAKEENSK